MAEFEHLEELVIGLQKRGAIGFAASEEEFITLKSGRRSPHYVNLRGMMSFARNHDMDRQEQRRIRDLMIKGYAFVLDNVPHDFDHIAGIPQAVTHVAGAVAQHCGESDLNIRVKQDEKGYGKHKPVEGDIEQGEVVVALDDVVTDGKSKDEVVEPLDLTGLVLKDYVVMVDRQEGGRASVEASGRTLTAIVGMVAVTDILESNGLITPQQVEWSDVYRQQHGSI
jgi:orotate phosphoribosyltransferase